MSTTPIFGLTGEHKIWNPNASPSLQSQYVGKQHYDISKKEGTDKDAVMKAWNIPHTTEGVKSGNLDKISRFGFNITERERQLKKQKKGGKSRKKRGGAPLMWMNPKPNKGDEIQLRTFHGTFKGRFDKLIDNNALFLKEVFRLRNGKWAPSQFILYQVAPAEDDEAQPRPDPYELSMFIKNDIETIEIIGKPSGASRAAGGRKRKTKRRKKKKRRKSRRKRKTKRGRKRRKRKTSRKKRR